MSMGGIQRGRVSQLGVRSEEGDGAREGELLTFTTGWSSIESGLECWGRADATSTAEVEPTTRTLARHDLAGPPNP